MNLECKMVDDVLVVKLLDSRIDAGNVGEFRTPLEGYLVQGVDKILLDVQDVDFIDSTGLGAMIALLKRLPESGVLGICNAGERVSGLLRLTRLNKVFVMFKDEAEGLQQLATSNQGPAEASMESSE